MFPAASRARHWPGQLFGHDARYLEFDDASHGLPIQHAERVNELLLDHLRGAEPTRTIPAAR